MKLFEKDELKLLWPFYLNQFLEYSFFIWISFYVIYFLQIGLSFFQISLLFATWSLSKMIFELPTGAVADIFGRKISVIISYIIYGFSLIILPFIKNFYILLFLFLLLGLSITFSSGAYESLVVDYLKFNKRKDLIHDFFIKHSSLFSLSGILSGVIGALVVKNLGLEYIWPITGIFALISGLILIFFIEENFKGKKVKIINSIKKTYKYSKFSINYCLKHPVLLYLILASFFVAMNNALGGLMVWQPLLTGLNFKVHWIGYLTSFGALIALGIPFLSKPLLKFVGKEKNYLALLYLTFFLICFSIIFVFSWQIAALIFILGIFPWELITPVSTKFFQHHTPSKYRATITSFDSMIGSFGSVLGTLITGFLLDFIGPKLTLFYSSFIMIPVIVLILFIKTKK